MAFPSRVSRVKRRRKGKEERENIYIYIKRRERKEGSTAQHGSLFFPQTMRLSSGISPLAGDEGRADVISDKFLIAFHRGPGLAFSLYLSALSYPRYRASEKRERGNQPALLLFNRVFLLITGVIPYVNSACLLSSFSISQGISPLISAIPIMRLWTDRFDRVGILESLIFNLSGSLFESCKAVFQNYNHWIIEKLVS